jgi:hypothetical protein
MLAWQSIHTSLLSGSYWLCHPHICSLEATGHLIHPRARSRGIVHVWSCWLCDPSIDCDDMILLLILVWGLRLRFWFLIFHCWCSNDCYVLWGQPPSCTEGRRTLIQILNWSYGLRMIFQWLLFTLRTTLLVLKSDAWLWSRSVYSRRTIQNTQIGH